MTELESALHLSGAPGLKNVGNPESSISMTPHAWCTDLCSYSSQTETLVHPMLICMHVVQPYRYLPTLFSRLWTGRHVCANDPLPKFCRLPDATAYTPWYSDIDIVDLPGVRALTNCIDRVRTELLSIKSTRADYAVVAQASVTAASAAPEDGEERAGNEAAHHGGGAWLVSGFQRFGTINQAMLDSCPVTWDCLQQFPIQDSWGEVGLCLPCPGP